MSKPVKKQSSYNEQRLKRRLADLGHTGIRVHWERLGGAAEMCGQGGGWFFRSDQERGQRHLGNSIGDALATAKWMYRTAPDGES